MQGMSASRTIPSCATSNIDAHGQRWTMPSLGSWKYYEGKLVWCTMFWSQLPVVIANGKRIKNWRIVKKEIEFKWINKQNGLKENLR